MMCVTMSTTPIRLAAVALVVGLRGAAFDADAAGGIPPAPQNGAATSVVNALGSRLQVALTAGADFSNITTEVPLVVSGVVHEADIRVDESGTEAAAATAVGIVEATGPPPDSQPEPVVMDVDHPFFFAIRDFNTTAVVFQGRVADPTR
jgi:serine protease inhibitor